MANASIVMLMSAGSTYLGFTGLIDAPHSYAGKSGEIVTVNPSATGVAFTAVYPLAAATGFTVSGGITTPCTLTVDQTIAVSALTSSLSSLSGAISAETIRAEGAESALTSSVNSLSVSIANETIRAEAAESALTSSVNSLSVSIANETIRAEAAESALTSSINSLSSSISAETIRAEAAEAALTSSINAEVIRAEAAESALTSSLSLYVPETTQVNGHALTSSIYVSSSDVGAVPTSTTVNGHALSSNVTVTTSDIGAVPTSTTVNGHALSSNVTVSASDAGAIPAPSSPSQGDILYYSGSAWARLAAGTSGYVLTTQGAGANPYWAAGGGGGGAVTAVFARTGSVVATSGDYTISQITNGLSNALASANLFVGNGSNVATGVALSGDATISNTGAITVTKTSGTSFGTAANLNVGTGANNIVQRDASGNFPVVNSPASATGSAGVKIPSGTAPTTPAAGDLYYDGTHLYFYSGSAHDLLASGGGSTDDTSWTGSNWTGTTSSPSQRATQQALGLVASDTLATSFTTANHGQPVMAYDTGYAPVTSGGVAKWTLANSLADSFGSYTLTNGGLTFATDGTFPLGSRYVASDDGSHFATFTPTGFPSGAAARSVVGWFKTSTSGVIVMWQYGNQSSGQDFSVYLNSGTLKVSQYGSDVYSGASSLNSGVWKHLALTYDGSTMKGYINAVLDTTVGSLTLNTGTNAGYVGADGGSYKWNGSLSDWRIYNRALTASEITAIYNGETGATQKYTPSAAPAAQNLCGSTTSAQSIAAGAAAGTSPTVSITGTRNSFQVSVATGSSGMTTGTIATVTFDTAFLNTPYCIIEPANAAAAALYSTTSVFATTTTSALTLTSGSAALASGTTYLWNFHVM